MENECEDCRKKTEILYEVTIEMGEQINLCDECLERYCKAKER